MSDQQQGLGSSSGGQTDFFCAQRSREAGVGLGGSAGYKPWQLVIETPEPWASVPTASAAFPAELNDLLKQSARQGRPVNVNAIAPDADYSRPGWRWVFFLGLNPAGGLQYECQSYLVPEVHVVPLVTQLLSADGGLGDEGNDPFKAYRCSKADEQRDILVCGHASRDRCCGRWGQELYHYLRQRPYLGQHKLRVWQSSHIGGHRFAPTLFEISAMRWWGQLSPQDADAVLTRQGPSAVVTRCYRGFAGLREPGEQLVEQAAFAQEGWAFLAAEQLQVETVPAAEGVSQVTLGYRLRAESQMRQFRAEVHSDGFVQAYGSCGDSEAKPQRQYRLQVITPPPLPGAACAAGSLPRPSR